jgi:hypothetical protein
MAECLDPDSKLFLLLFDLFNSPDKYLLNCESELKKLLIGCVNVMGGHFFQLRPLNLRALLMEQITLLFCLISIFTDHTKFIAFRIDADRITWIAIDTARRR